MIRKIATLVPKIGRLAVKPTRKSSRPTRQFSNLIADRERAEETKYIKAQEEIQKAELRASFEKLLASESEDKEEILEILSSFGPYFKYIIILTFVFFSCQT